jgi:MFS family permease
MFILERGDESILPAVFKFVGESLVTDPKGLANIQLSRALTQAAVAPFSGIAGDRFNRVHVVSVGALIWGLATIAMGLMTDLRQAYGFAVFNGIGLSLIVPSVQSLIADAYGAGTRGSAFGALYMISSLGSMAVSFFSTSVGGQHIGRLAGWRFAFLLVGAVSLAAGAAVLCVAHDPRAAEKKRRRALALTDATVVDAPLHRWAWDRLKSMGRDIKMVLAVPTFVIIVLQGIVGSMPWTAMGFSTLYLQSSGFTDLKAAVVASCFSLGCALGSALGGVLGDAAQRRVGNRGRVAVNQFSVAVSIPAALVILKWLPQGSGAPGSADGLLGVYAPVFFLAGSLISWCGTNNSAIFSQVVPEQLRSSIYAFDRAFETAIGSLAGPIVGALTPLFGFSGTLKYTADTSVAVMRTNARALANAMLVMMIVPWILCFLAFCGLYWTLDRDEARAHEMAATIAAEAAAAAAVAGGGAAAKDGEGSVRSGKGGAVVPAPASESSGFDGADEA